MNWHALIELAIHIKTKLFLLKITKVTDGRENVMLRAHLIPLFCFIVKIKLYKCNFSEVSKLDARTASNLKLAVNCLGFFEK